jgi:hypothetical protein
VKKLDPTKFTDSLPRTTRPPIPPLQTSVTLKSLS